MKLFLNLRAGCSDWEKGFAEMHYNRLDYVAMDWK